MILSTDCDAFWRVHRSTPYGGGYFGGACPRKAGIMACGILWAENASSQEVHMENWRRHRDIEKVDDQRGEVAINPGV